LTQASGSAGGDPGGLGGASSGAFDLEHRRVGETEQRLGVVGVGRIDGPPDARPEPEVVTGDSEWFSERLPDTVRETLEVLLVLRGDQHAELVAAEPGHEIVTTRAG